MADLSDLLPYASTERQQEVINAVIQCGSNQKASKQLGVGRRTVERTIQRVRDLAARQGYSPDHDMTRPVPNGFLVKGVSTYYNDEGKPTGQWVKSQRDAEQQVAMLRDAVTAMTEDLPKIKATKAPRGLNSKLLAAYPMGDPHFGMYSYGEETGADFDLDIARADLCAAVDYLVDQAPACERAVVMNLGDFFHADNIQGITTRSGNVLDMDSRMSKVVRVGVSALRQCIESALKKHKTVEVVNAIGNHDDMLSLALSIMLANIYEKERRVIIHDQPTPRHYIQHGKVLLGVTHGHNTKDRDLPGIMATERPSLWGETKHRYFYRGHHHHDSRDEYNGCIVEQFRTLAAGEAYAVEHGYLSGRDMKCIIHHQDYGEAARSTCSIDMLR